MIKGRPSYPCLLPVIYHACVFPSAVIPFGCSSLFLSSSVPIILFALCFYFLFRSTSLPSSRHFTLHSSFLPDFYIVDVTYLFTRGYYIAHSTLFFLYRTLLFIHFPCHLSCPDSFLFPITNSTDLPFHFCLFYRPFYLYIQRRVTFLHLVVVSPFLQQSASACRSCRAVHRQVLNLHRRGPFTLQIHAIHHLFSP